MFSGWTCQGRRKGPKMCSLSTQSRAAGSPGGILDRDKIGDPSMRLWTSHQPSGPCFFHSPVLCGPMAFSAHHTPSSRTCLCPGGKRILTAVCPAPKQQPTLQEHSVQVCTLLPSPSIFLGELRNPKRPGPCPTKDCLQGLASTPGSGAPE